MAKGRESDMPPPELWESFFDPAAILQSLGCRNVRGDLIEFGCGYGTFTVAAAPHVSGIVYAMDIDAAMIATASARVAGAGLTNVVMEQRDLIVDGSGRPDGSSSYVMILNLLHIEDPVRLLREAYRGLRSGGTVGVTHWKVHANTPRGPSLEIRPHPEQCRVWGEQAGLRWVGYPDLPGTPWHWGMILERP